MKKIVYLVFLTFLISCKTVYHSYLYDIDSKMPIENVKIYDNDSLVGKTNKKGYFELKKIKGSELTFKKKDYRITTIRKISIQSGEFIEKSFTGDTIYLIHSKSKYNKYYENQ